MTAQRHEHKNAMQSGQFARGLGLNRGIGRARGRSPVRPIAEEMNRTPEVKVLDRHGEHR